MGQKVRLLLLLTHHAVAVLDEFLALKKMRTCVLVDSSVLVIDHDCVLQLDFVEQRLTVYFEIRKALSAIPELHLLDLILRREHSLIALLEVLLLRVNLVKDFEYVIAQTVTVRVEGAKLTQKGQHLWNVLSNHQSVVGAVV